MGRPRREYLAHHLRSPGLQIAAALRCHGTARRAVGARREVLVGPRLPFVAGRFPVAYVKRRPLGDRFGRGPSRAAMTSPDQVLEARERQALVTICADVRLDFGELDVLRDRGTGGSTSSTSPGRPGARRAHSARGRPSGR